MQKATTPNPCSSGTSGHLAAGYIFFAFVNDYYPAHNGTTRFNNSKKILPYWKKIVILQPISKEKKGVLAQ